MIKIYTLRQLFLMNNDEFKAKIDDRFIKLDDLPDQIRYDLEKRIKRLEKKIRKKP